MRSLMEIVGSDEQLAYVGFTLTPGVGGCVAYRSDGKNEVVRRYDRAWAHRKDG